MIQAILTLLSIQQAVVYLSEEAERAHKYWYAWTEARLRQKPLLVVGGPYGTSGIRQLFRIKAHGCGDLCVDIDPRACMGCPYQPGDVRQLSFRDKLFGVAFNSHVLEHMPSANDCIRAWQELHRVADEVVTCLPSKASLAAWLAPGHHLWVEELDSQQLRIEERRRKPIAILK